MKLKEIGKEEAIEKFGYLPGRGTLLIHPTDAPIITNNIQHVTSSTPVKDGE